MVDKGCPSVTIIINFTKTLLHEYNLLKLFMKYSLVNKVAFKELPKIIRNLREVVDNYEYFSDKSVKIIVNMAVVVLNSAADVMLPNGEIIGMGQYIFKRIMEHGISIAALYDFIFLIETIRRDVI